MPRVLLQKIIVIVLLSFSSFSAHAILIFSDVSYTANSVTFTLDGDMTGYVYGGGVGSPRQFSLVYGGDIGSIFIPASANTWSQSVFDNKTISSNGRTGIFTSSTPYSWSTYNSSLIDAVATNRTVTLNLGANHLNPGASIPMISFGWGLGFNSPNNLTLLTSVDVNNQSVPEPSVLALLGLGCVILTAKRRRRNTLGDNCVSA